MYYDLAEYLACTEQWARPEKTSTVRLQGRKAFSYFDSKWPEEVLYHPMTRHTVSWRQTAPPPWTSIIITIKYSLGVHQEGQSQWEDCQQLLHLFCRVLHFIVVTNYYNDWQTNITLPQGENNHNDIVICKQMNMNTFILCWKHNVHKIMK